MMIIVALMYRLNPDSSTGKTEQRRGRDSTSADTALPINEQARRGSSACCALCVRATVEEDDEHKDIRVRISDASTFVNIDGERDKTAVVKFCTPLVCTEAARRIFPTDETSKTRTNGSPSLPRSSEASGSKEARNTSDITLTENGTIGESNQTPRTSLSNKINKTLRSLNCKGNAKKTRADRDVANNGEEMTNSSTENKSVYYTEDDTSGYTSGMANFRCRSSGAMQSVAETNQLGRGEKREAIDDGVAAAETLRILQRLLENAGQPEVEGRRARSERSRSVPRGRSRERESDLVRSNASFPVRVDYSDAALTAADLTRPEFVRMLTEIKEQTRNLEQQLSQMNSAMRSTSFNDAVSDAKVETEESKFRVTCEETDKNMFAGCKHILIDSGTVELCHDLGDSVSRNGVAGRSRKAKKNNRNKDASSQSDCTEIDEIVASTPEERKKIGRKSAEQDSSAVNARAQARRSEDNESNVFAQRSENGAKSRHDMRTSMQERRKESTDNLRVSKNCICVERSNEAAAGTQTVTSPRLASTADEAVTAKPSKIHKLKKSAVPTSNQPTETRPEIRGENSGNSARSAEQKRFSASPRSPGRMNWTPVNAPRTGSLIPMRQGAPAKPRSAPAHSTLSRIAAGSSTADLPQSVHPTTSIEMERQRGRSPTRFSLRKSSARGSSAQTRRTGESSTGSPEARSRSNNFDGSVSMRESIVFQTLHDTFDASGSRTRGRSKVTEVERNRVAPKPFASRTMKKSPEEEGGNEVARRSQLDESATSFTTDTCGTSEGDLRDNAERQIISRKLRTRTPETGRIDDQNGNSRHPTSNSSPTRRSAYTVGRLFERRTSGMVYRRDGSAVDNGRTPVSGSSRSPASRSRKLESEKELALTNYSSKNGRLANVGIDGAVDKADGKGVNNFNAVYNNDRKLKVQQRSKSDPRESRNNVGRGSR